MIINLLERVFRRDITNVFKKRLLKSKIDQLAKYRLLEKEPEYAFYNELEKEVVYNSVIFSLSRLLVFQK
jgi:hypothetical protein